MYHYQNFALLSVIFERFQRYTPEEFINKCFAEHDEHHRTHLLGKYKSCGENVLRFMPLLDLEHMREVNIFMNSIIKPEERHHYEYTWDLLG